MPKDRTGQIKTSLASYEVHQSHADQKESEVDCQEIRQASTVWQIGKKEKTTTKNQRPPFAPTLKMGQKVYCQDGYVGKIVAIRMDFEAKIVNFTVQSGHLFSRRRVVPLESVDRVEAERLFLSAKKDDFKLFPENSGYGMDYFFNACFDG